MIVRGEPRLGFSTQLIAILAALAAVAALSGIVRAVLASPAEDRVGPMEAPLAPALVAALSMIVLWALAWVARAALSRREDHYIEDLEEAEDADGQPPSAGSGARR